MLVTFPDGAEGVVARVRAWLRSSAPGIYDVGVDAQMIAEPGERLQAALVAGWAPAEPPA